MAPGGVDLALHRGTGLSRERGMPLYERHPEFRKSLRWPV